jgi:NAD(P)-dependent dehydrogenase (short-subunit alcohol dehydrogenase family)
MDVNLRGMRAVVVGAGQTPGESLGMGKATALLFAREGARVTLVDRNADQVNETADMLRAEGHDPIVSVADITTASECRRLVADAVKAMGGIDVLQNTVGIRSPVDPTLLEESDWDRTLDTNLKGMWATSASALVVMREQRSGSIVNYSSLAALYGRVNGAYGISKAGVNALTTSLAFFNAPFQIRVNAIMPGLIDTPMAVDGRAEMTGRPREAIAEERAAKCPMGFAGDAWDCARLALFLASDASRYISGACIPVDGAYGTGAFYAG